MTSPKSFIVLLAPLILSGLLPTAFAQAPANDNLTNAIPLYGSSVTFTGTLDNATFEFDPGEDPCACQFRCYPGGSVWWSWTATNTTAVVIEVVQQTGCRDVAFGAHLGTSTTNVTTLDCNILDSLPHRYVAFSATAGVTYYFRVMGTFDSPSSFTLQLTATNTPKILSAPASQTADGNASAVFTVVPGGLRPLNYQWQFQGNNLPGQTTPALIVHRVGPAQEGGYSVVVSNVAGVVTSAVANLTLSGTNALPKLGASNDPISGRFILTAVAQTDRPNTIEVSTNLLHFQELYTVPDDYIFSQNGPTSTLSISRNGVQRFYRPSFDQEICIAHLKVIDAAINLMAAEQKRERFAAITESDLWPYLGTNENFVCPSGGTCFCDSYRVTTVNEQPACMKVAFTHRLPEP